MIIMKKHERAIVLSISYEEYHRLMQANQEHGFLDEVKEVETLGREDGGLMDST